MTGNIQNKLANRLRLNHSSGNIKVTHRFKHRNGSLVNFKTDKSSSYDIRQSLKTEGYRRAMKLGIIIKVLYKCRK